MLFLVRHSELNVHENFRLQLHSEREAIPDAPAVYFIRPTEANVKRVAEDCAKQVSYYCSVSQKARTVQVYLLIMRGCYVLLSYFEKYG